MIARFVSDVMSAERFKQEAALIVLDRLTQAGARDLVEHISRLNDTETQKLLEDLEAAEAKIIARVAESIADAVVGALGPVLLPKEAP